MTKVKITEYGQFKWESWDVVLGVMAGHLDWIGVLYKSSNDSGWTPIQNEDLKFTLFKGFIQL